MSHTRDKIYDLCIIGGGINGVGIARDAAGRGLRVLLVEQDDLGHATSSASTKLVHGGLRYLEYYEFRLVRESLLERDVLLGIAPHIIWPLNFVLPDAHSVRPFWMVRAGLYLYDLLSISLHGRKFPVSRWLNLRRHKFGAPLKEDYRLGVQYSDGWVHDSRLVVLNAMDAKARGADILTRTQCLGLTPTSDGNWLIDLKDRLSGADYQVNARMAVNAAGPWVHSMLEKAGLVTPQTPSIRLVQGSHIVVPRIHDGEQAYMLQQSDRRIVFAIPYEEKFTLIGTTETEVKDVYLAPKISDAEIDYLVSAANGYFRKQISRNDIVWTYSGVRPLLEDENADARKVTRDYKVHEEVFGTSRIVSVFGGKITTYRKLAEKVTDLACARLDNVSKSWTGKRPLPGGDIPSGNVEAFFKLQKMRWEREKASLMKRYILAYGTKMTDIMTTLRGENYGDDVFEAEIRYLIKNEFAITLEDILWRRSKLGLHISKQTKENIEKDLPRLVKEITGYDIENNTGI